MQLSDEMTTRMTRVLAGADSATDARLNIRLALDDIAGSDCIVTRLRVRESTKDDQRIRTASFQLGQNGQRHAYSIEAVVTPENVSAKSRQSGRAER